MGNELTAEDEHAAELALLTQRFALGDRVQARVDIVDAVTAITIETGYLGTVTEVDAHGCTPLVRVRWDEFPSFDRFLTMVSHLRAVAS